MKLLTVLVGFNIAAYQAKSICDVICEAQYLTPLPSKDYANNFMLINKSLSTIYAVQ